jgi:predicted DNA-binding transcriptional regulator AlpA
VLWSLGRRGMVDGLIERHCWRIDSTRVIQWPAQVYVTPQRTGILHNMTTPTVNLISFSATARKVGVGENTLRRMIGRGEFINAVQVSPRRIAFIEAEIVAWVATRPRGPLPRPPTASRQNK